MEGEGRSSSPLNAVNIPPGQSPAEESTKEGVKTTCTIYSIICPLCYTMYPLYYSMYPL